MVTVAVGLTDPVRRVQLENLLSSAPRIRLCVDTPARTRPLVERRRCSRGLLSPLEQAWARSRRLRPQVLLASLGLCTAEDGRFLSGLQADCPKTRILLLADSLDEATGPGGLSAEQNTMERPLASPASPVSSGFQAEDQTGKDKTPELDALIFQALQRGAHGVITADASDNRAHLERAALAVHHGEAWVPRRLLTRMLQQVQAATSAPE